MKKHSRSLLAAAAALLLAGAAHAAPRPAGIAPAAQSLADVAKIDVPVQDNESLRAEALILDETGPYHFAKPLPSLFTPSDSGTWEDLGDGTSVWRLRVRSEGARNLNFGFGQFWLPAGSAMFLYNADYSTVYGPFTEADNDDHGEFWTPILEGEESVIEVRLPNERIGELLLALTSINHGYRGLGEYLDSTRSGSCNVDVVCPEGDNWREQIRSVAVYGSGGSTFCTGALVNNTAQDRKGYFLTANHCGVDSGEAPSIVVYWNFQNSTCRAVGSGASGGAGNGSLGQFNSGTIFRAANSASDMTLIELDDPINTAYNPYWAGWDRSGANATAAIAIHHPNTDEKRISFENAATTVTTYLQNTVPGDSTHIRVIDWDLGTTEPGSSGSPLFDQNKRIIGQLHGGFAACGNNDSDWYGRIFTSWTGGGTNSTRLSNWLDPSNSGVTVLDGLGLSDIGKNGEPAISDTAGDNDGVAERGETVSLTISLRNSGTSTASSIASTLTALTPGVTVVQGSSAYPSITAGSTAANSTPFTITIGPEVACGTSISLSLAVTSSSTPATIGYTVTTGPTCNFIPNFSGGTLAWSEITGNGNGFADPGELISVTLPVSNSEGAASGVNGTLTSPDANVSMMSGASAYPNISTGQTQSNSTPFQVMIGSAFPCGDKLTLALDVASATGTGTMSWELQTGRPEGAALQTFNFDGGLTLPPFTAATGTGTNNWAVRATTGTNSAPNAASYQPGPTTVADAYLVSPVVNNATQLQFFHSYAFENTFDGGVIEITTNGGGLWTDLLPQITEGTYAAGVIDDGYGSALANRRAWTGGGTTFNAWSRVTVDLTPYSGETIQVRWRFASDSSQASGGWRVDSIVFTTPSFTCDPVNTSGTDIWMLD